MALFIPPPKPPRVDYRAGLWYVGPAVPTTGTASNNEMRVRGLYLERPRTMNGIGLELTIAGESGATIRFVVYKSKPGETYPGDLMYESAVVAADSIATPFKSKTDFTLDVPAGTIWVGVVFQSAVTTRPTCRIDTNAVPGNIGTTAGTGFNSATGYAQAGVTGAAPATFSDSPVVATSPLVPVKFA